VRESAEQSLLGSISILVILNFSELASVGSVFIVNVAISVRLYFRVKESGTICSGNSTFPGEKLFSYWEKE
jgi:hypothetical protein